MRRSIVFFALWLSLAAFVPLSANDQPTPPLPLNPTWRDDAALHGVTVAGREIAFAVGDHGVFWKTTNGGKSWDRIETGTAFSLKTLLAPTDKFLIAAGGGREPHSAISRGVLLVSRDGGLTWTDRARLADGTHLPRLHGAHFISPTEGIVWGEPSVAGGPWAGTGVFRTEDGGDTWQPVPVPSTTGWQTAAFLDLEQGLVANRLGEARLVLGFASEPSRLDRLADRRLHDVSLERGGHGWLAGDSGTLLRTDNSGISWQAVPTLPAVVRRAVDFHAVWSREQTVLAAGNPGSVIWRSLDGGRNWDAVPTPISTPIHDIALTAEGTGYAVGALGVILKTTDHGGTWTTVLGGDRRAAALVIAPRATDIPWPVISDYAAEQGYRLHVSLLASNGDSDQVEATAPATGAVDTDVAPRLSLTRPDLERDAARLIALWDETSEGTWRRQLVSTLVRDLRAWRPSVVIAGPSRPGDAVSLLIDEAIARACDDSGDPTLHIDLADQLHLPAWAPNRRFVASGQHVTAGGATVTVDAARFLPRLGLSGAAFLARVAATGPTDSSNRIASGLTAGGFGLTSAPDLQPGSSVGLILKPIAHASPSPKGDIPSDIFSGLGLTPDSPARRPLPPITSSDLTQSERSARNLRTVESFLSRSISDRRLADQLIAQLPELTRDLPPDQAAAQLASIAARYRDGHRWDAAEQVCLELLRRYPDEAATRIELARQITLWSSAEWAWQNLRGSTVIAGRSVGAPAAASSSKIVQIGGQQSANGDAASRSTLINADAARAALDESGRVTLRRNVNERLEQRLRLAEQAAETLAKQSPTLAAGPEVQLALAAAMRSLGRSSSAADIYRRFAAHPGNNPWTRAARTELWLVTPSDEPSLPLRSIFTTATRPHLDGLLSDPCWEAAEEISADTSEKSPLLLLVSRDNEFLYIAGSATRAASSAEAPAVAKARDYDASLEGHDRITLVIDIDRDYNLGWEWTIDERGLTRDACCGDLAWNPKYFLASSSDKTTWRFELAIPWDELAPAAPSDRAKIAFRACRTIPGVGWQTWPASPGSTPASAPFGLLSFDE